MSKKFQYKVLKQSTEGGFFTAQNIDSNSLEKTLNNMGKQGWELLSPLAINSNQGATSEVVLIFKKEEPLSGDKSYE